MSPVLATEFQPINLTEVMGIFMGMMVVLIPIIGATIRFSAKPLVDALLRAGIIGTPQAHALANSVSMKDHDLLTRRVLELEQEVAQLKGKALPAIDEKAALSDGHAEVVQLANRS